MKHYKPDFFHTDKFIKLIYQEDNPLITVRYIKPGVSKSLYGRYKDLKHQIMYLNKNRIDIYLMVNPSYSDSTKADSVQKAFCYYIDIDAPDKGGRGSLPEYYTVQPSCITAREDGKGYHLYWCVKKPLDLSTEEARGTWSSVQLQHINFYKSDQAIHDPGRIMRLPGTYRWKGQNPLMYKIHDITSNYYTSQEIINSFQDKKKLKEVALKRIKQFKNDISIDGKIPEGRRGDFLIKTVFFFNDYGFTHDDILQDVKDINNKYVVPPLPDKEIEATIKNVKYAQNTSGEVAAQKEIDRLKKLELVKKALIDWYYIEIGGFFIYTKNLSVTLSKEAFNARFAPITESSNPAGFCFRYSLVKLALQIVYEPEEDPVLEIDENIFINIWRGSDLQPLKKTPTWFIAHVKYLLPKPEEHEYIFDFFAHMVQKPREKIRHALILIGPQGVGKSFLIDLFRQIFGETNIKKPSNDDLSDRYSGWAKECQLCFIDEIEQADKKSFINKIKPIISEDTIRVREMFKDSYQINNYMSIFATTNDIHPVLLDKDDRRFMIFKSDAKPKGKTYYEKFIRARDTRAGEVLHFLASRDISKFHAGARPPMTDAKQDIIGYSRNDLVAEIEELVEAKEYPFDKDVVFIEDIKEFFVLEKRMHRITLNRITKVFQNLGFINESQTRVNINGAYRRSWIIRNFDSWLEALGSGMFIQNVKRLYDESEIDNDKIVNIS